MSGLGQSTPTRLKFSTGSSKQGPLRATMPISFATKEGSSLRSASPTISPPNFWKTTMGQRSPGSYINDGRLPPRNKGNTMRRTASLDTIYLRGFFPRDGLYWNRDRTTQTEVSNSLESLSMSNQLTEAIDDKLSKLNIRSRRRCVLKDPNYESNISTTNRVIATKSSRSSEEGLNQEIERIILRSESDPHCSGRLRQPTPEGRKAPVADLFKKQTVNIQTPPYGFSFSENITSNQDMMSRDLLSPIPGHSDTPHSETEESQGSSPDQERMNPSPRINKFKREPPDGCERVFLKAVPLIKPVPLEAVPAPNSLFKLTPSSGSAFKCLNKTVEDNSPLVPNNNDKHHYTS